MSWTECHPLVTWLINSGGRRLPGSRKPTGSLDCGQGPWWDLCYRASACSEEADGREALVVVPGLSV